MKQSVWQFLAVLLLFMASSAFAQERAGNAEPDDNRDYTKEVKYNAKIMKVQKNGKFEISKKNSNRALTARDRKKLAEIEQARANPVKKVSKSKKTVLKARNAHDQKSVNVSKKSYKSGRNVNSKATTRKKKSNNE